MGLLAKLFGANWQCANCGEQYVRNRTQCGNCGHTVFERPS